MTRDPAFWALIVGFAAIWFGIAVAFDHRFIPMRNADRVAMAAVLLGIAIVTGATAAKVFA